MNEPVINVAQTVADSAVQFRSKVGHISRQSSVYFMGTIFTAAFGYLFKVYVARVLGPEALGIFALGVTMIGFLGIFNTLGLPQSAMRFVAEYQASGKLKELHALLWRGAGLLLVANIFFVGLLLSCGGWVAIHFYHSPALVRYLPLFAVIMLFAVVNTFYGRVLAGYHDLQLRTLIVNFIGSPLSMLVAVGLISAGLGLSGYLIAQIVSAAVVCILLIATVRRFTPPAARLFAKHGSSPAKEVWSFSAAVLGVTGLEFVMSQADKVALGFYRGPKEVGIYSVAAAVVVYIPLALSSVNQIFASMISDLHARGNHVLLARLFQSLTKWVVGLTLPLALVVIVFAAPLMRIFGREFEIGWPILVIGTAGQLINCGVGSVGYLLLMSGNEKRLIKVQVAMTAVMIILSAVLVPLWGIYGAAAAAAVTNVGMNAWNLLEVRRAMGISPYNRGYIHLLLPTIATLGVVLAAKKYSFVFSHYWIMVGVAFVTAYCVFPAVFYFVGGLDPDDRLIASALWSRVRGAIGRAGAQA